MIHETREKDFIAPHPRPVNEPGMICKNSDSDDKGLDNDEITHEINPTHPPTLNSLPKALLSKNIIPLLVPPRKQLIKVHARGPRIGRQARRVAVEVLRR